MGQGILSESQPWSHPFWLQNLNGLGSATFCFMTLSKAVSLWTSAFIKFYEMKTIISWCIVVRIKQGMCKAARQCWTLIYKLRFESLSKIFPRIAFDFSWDINWSRLFDSEFMFLRCQDQNWASRGFSSRTPHFQCFHFRGLWVRLLVREQRSQVPCGVAKNEIK